MATKEKCTVSAEVEGDTRLLIFAYHRKKPDIPDEIILRCQVVNGQIKVGDAIKTQSAHSVLQAKILSIQENCSTIPVAKKGMKVGLLVAETGIEEAIRKMSDTIARFHNPHAVMA